MFALWVCLGLLVALPAPAHDHHACPSQTGTPAHAVCHQCDMAACAAVSGCAAQPASAALCYGYCPQPEMGIPSHQRLSSHYQYQHSERLDRPPKRGSV
ncbi:hypothetical protein EOE65_16630 [Neptunomonas marina]|uniref:Secreted protein n=1 Tax=Neptunomonas marina TaxID=1815562 RepID=A0A437Q4F5_9GAMM|nr:hypothetical protein EOE65_16630 [Neptunomonas marina]